MFYYNEEQNFGDSINPILVERLFNVDVEHKSPLEADLLGIGSIAQTLFANKANILNINLKKYFKYSTVNIWGSGFNGSPEYFAKKRPHYRQPETFARKIKPLAVRGKFSKNRIEQINNTTYNDVVLGDPGLLISNLYEKPIVKKYKLGIIPHYVDFQNPIFAKIHEEIPNSIIINMKDDPFKIIEEISECESIISTALHGLIAADSFNIPNAWVSVSNNIVGEGYKFKDYYSVFDIENPTNFDLNSTEINKEFVDNIFENYQITSDKVSALKEGLIKSFPFK